MSFPTNPTNGQTASVNGKSYVYNATKDSWSVAVTTGSVPGSLITPSGTVAGNLNTTGNLVVSNNASITGNANITGNATISGDVTADGISGADLTVSNAAGVTGNLTVGGILTDNYYYANGSPFTPASNGGGGSGTGLTLDAGSILFSISNTAPNSFVSANGVAVNNTTYPNLNAAINANSSLRISGTVYAINRYAGQTAPAGTTYNSSTSIDAGRVASKAFDGSVDGTTGCWHSSGGPPQWIQVTFTSPIVINKWDWQRRAQNDGYPINWTLSGSNDGGTTKTLLYTKTSDGGVASGNWNENQFTNANAYTTYRMDISSSSGGSYVIIGEIRCATVGDNTQYYLPNYNSGLPSGVYAYVATDSVGGGGSGGGTTTYATPNLLPLSANAGTMAYVLSNNRLYVFNSGWYSIAAVTQTPTFSDTPGTTVNLGSNANSYSYTIAASDPEGVPLTYDFTVVSGLNANLASINSSTGVFTADFTSISEAQITFTASDGVNIASATSTFYYLDPNFEYTTLLLKAIGSNTQTNSTFIDSSTNNFSITPSSSPKQGAFSPYYGEGYYSAYFDGTGDYLTAASNSALDFDSSDFTIEAWVNFSALSSNRILLERWTSGNANGWQLYWRATGTSLTFYAGNAIVLQDPGANTIKIGQWHHVAVTRSGTTARMFIDGTQVASATNSTSLTNALTLGVGRQLSTNTNDFNGYMSNVRIVKGTALYTANFTPSTTPLTAVSGTSILMCQSNRFKDNSTNNFTITRNGDVKVTAFGPFNASAIYSAETNGGSFFEGSLQTGSSSAFGFGSGDFTIEFWIYTVISSWGADERITDTGNTSGNINITVRGGLGIVNEAVAHLVENSGVYPNKNEWNHIALTRSGTTLRLFKNGSQIATATSSAGNASGTFKINSIGNFISDVRVVKGTALYTSTFTPPTSKLTAVANTSILLAATNSGIIDATRKHNVTLAGSAAVSTVQKKFSTENSIVGAADAYILAPASTELEFGSGDFTIEFWWYPTSTARQALYHGSFGIDWSLGIDYSSVSTNQKIGIWASSNGSSWNLINADPGGNGIGTTTVTQNAWNHIAFVRNGTTWMLFVNGNRDLNLTGISGSVVSRVTYPKAIGTWFSSTAIQEQLGYLQDFRISKYARYTANFTIPASAFLTR